MSTRLEDLRTKYPDDLALDPFPFNYAGGMIVEARYNDGGRSHFHPRSEYSQDWSDYAFEYDESEDFYRRLDQQYSMFEGDEHE